jgi:hypothetical protein
MTSNCTFLHSLCRFLLVSITHTHHTTVFLGQALLKRAMSEYKTMITRALQMHLHSPSVEMLSLCLPMGWFNFIYVKMTWTKTRTQWYIAMKLLEGSMHCFSKDKCFVSSGQNPFKGWWNYIHLAIYNITTWSVTLNFNWDVFLKQPINPGDLDTQVASI